jgi:hypothetical protein
MPGGLPNISDADGPVPPLENKGLSDMSMLDWNVYKCLALRLLLKNAKQSLIIADITI